MADFPMGTIKEDSRKRKEGHAHDPAQSHEVEGGYTLTRPRFTRRPRRLWTIGFTDLTTTQKDLIKNFWEAKLGSSNSFTWLDPVSGSTITVRFKGKPDYNYTGVGTAMRWSVDNVVLEEV